MDDRTAATKLVQDLEDVSGSALTWLAEVLAMPIDSENSGLLRAQSSAAQTALNTQLRADALRLRAQREDKALETLMKMIREKELVVPQEVNERLNARSLQPLHSLEHNPDDTVSSTAA